MDRAMWQSYFDGDELTDFATKTQEETLFTTTQSDVHNLVNIQIESRMVSDVEFINPSEAYLMVEYQLKKLDDTNYDEDDNIALVNGWSLFSKAELNYNSVNVGIVDEPGSVSTILGLVEDPEDYESKGTLEYRFYDTTKDQKYTTSLDAAGGPASESAIGTDAEVPTKPVNLMTQSMENADATSAANLRNLWRADLARESSIVNQNEGQTKRLKRAPPANSENWIKLKLSDIFGVCKVNKPLRGIKMELMLTKETNHNKNLLRGPRQTSLLNLTNNGAAPPVYAINRVARTLSDPGKILINKVKLIVPSVKAHEEIFLDLNKELRSGKPIPLNFQRIWCKHDYSTFVGGGTMTYNFRVMSNTKRPRHLFVAIQDVKRRNGANGGQVWNPLIFDRPDGIRAEAQVGNVRYPRQEYSSAVDGYVRLYNAFLNASGKNHDPMSSSFLTFDKWKNLYPIMYFDLSHNDNSFEVSMDTEIVVNMTLTNAPNFNVQTIVISDEYKEISEQSNIVRITDVNPIGLKN